MVTQASDSAEYVNFQQGERMGIGEYRFECKVHENILSGKTYYLNVHVINVKNEHYTLLKALNFTVKFSGYNGVLYGAYESAFFRPKLDWNYSKL